jgi:hypothetical protein
MAKVYSLMKKNGKRKTMMKTTTMKTTIDAFSSFPVYCKYSKEVD